jgi:hypothetical protein
MIYDPSTGNVVLFGGSNGNGGGDLGDTWTWNGATWVQLSQLSSPIARFGASIACDPVAGNVVLFGGVNGSSSFLADTWTWSGTTWTEQTPIIHPSNRWCASLSYDPATGYAVLFGGDNNGALVNDTWAWSGSTWVQQAPSVSPSPRVCAAIKGHLAVSTCVHDHERLTSVYCNLGLVPLPGGV